MPFLCRNFQAEFLKASEVMHNALSEDLCGEQDLASDLLAKVCENGSSKCSRFYPVLLELAQSHDNRWVRLMALEHLIMSSLLNDDLQQSVALSGEIDLIGGSSLVGYFVENLSELIEEDCYNPCSNECAARIAYSKCPLVHRANVWKFWVEHIARPMAF